MTVGGLPFAVKWRVAGAADLERAQSWMKDHVFGAWKAELVGVEDTPDPASSEARIAIRYTFEREDDRRGFVREFPDAAIESVVGGGIAPPGSPSEEDAARQAASVAGDGFEDGARRILAGPQPVSAGKVHLLGLDRVKAHFGDNWEKLAPRVEAMVQRAIERRLTPRDVYRSCGGLNYVILFADLSDREANFKCGMMAEEISRMLVGDEMGGMLEVHSVAAAVDGGAMLEKAGDPAQLVRELEAIVEEERRRQVAAARAEFEIGPDDDPVVNVHVTYRPIWDVRRSVVASFLCMPVYKRPGRETPVGDLPAAAPHDEGGRQKLDSQVINRVIDDLAVMHKRRRRLMICMPVHFDSVSTPSRRRELLDHWQRVPREYKQLAIFELVGLPEGVPQGRVGELVSALKPNSGGVFARVPIGTPTLRNFADTGLIAVGTDLAASSYDEDRLMKELRNFIEGAEKARLMAYVHGLRTFSLTLAAITNGYALIDGDSISAVTEQPDIAFRLNIEDIYSRVLPKAP